MTVFVNYNILVSLILQNRVSVNFSHRISGTTSTMLENVGQKTVRQS